MSETVLYRAFRADGSLLYVGIASNWASRWKQHLREKTWALEVDSVRLQRFPSRVAAEDAEREAITQERPRHNTMVPRVVQETPPVPPVRKRGRPRTGPDGRRACDLPRVSLRLPESAMLALRELMTRWDKPAWQVIAELIEAQRVNILLNGARR